MNVIKEPSDGYWSNVWLKKPFCACYWSGRATEDWMFSSAYEAGVPWNDSFWNHERFNKPALSRPAPSSTAPSAPSCIARCRSSPRTRAASSVPMYANWIDGKSKKLAHPEVTGNAWPMDGLRIMERWWFA